jgi:uncharacterized protein
MNPTRETTALVTGATGGIGAAIARRLRRDGLQVIVTGRRADRLRELEIELGARPLRADLTERDAPRRLLDEAGPIDVLVVNAALPASGVMASFTDDEIDRALDVNLRAPIVLARHAAEGMAARGGGQIVFIASIGAKVASARTALYCASKFGLRGFALALRDELASSGVGVTTIYPGFIRDAGMFADTGVALPPGVGTRSPEDVAAAVVRAIRKNPAELSVAPLLQRFLAFLGCVSPALSSAMQRAFDGSAIADALAAAQRDKR